MRVSEIALLFEHNYWARDQILAAVGKLSEEELTEASIAGWGSILGVLGHMVNAEAIWRMRFNPQEGAPTLLFPDALASLAELQARWHEEAEHMLSFINSLTDDQLNSPIQYTGMRGGTYENVLWHILLQLLEHGVAHRSEIALRLTELGHSPGDLDFIIYIRDVMT